MTDFKGKTALATGSTSGIGRATAIALAARGAHAPIVGRDEQRAKDAVAEIEGSGGSAAFRLATLVDGQSADDLVEWAYEAGDGHVDILVNNAGVALLGPSMAATEAEFNETFALNVKVPFFIVASRAPAMAEREKYAGNAGQTAEEYGAEILANSKWGSLDGAPMVSSGAIVRFPDHEPALRWCNSSDYQQLIEVRGVAIDAPFSLLDGLPRSTEGERESV